MYIVYWSWILSSLYDVSGFISVFCSRGGKWNELAQCVRKHAHVSGSGGHAPPGKFLIL